MHKRNYWRLRLPAGLLRFTSWLSQRWFNLAKWQRIVCATLAGVMLLAAIIPTVQHIMESRRYELSDQVRQLIGSTDKNLAAKISYDTKSASWLFNKGDIPIDGAATHQAQNDMPTPNMLKASAGGSGKNDQSLYAVHMPSDGTQGIKYYDTNTRLSFSLVPQFDITTGKSINGQLLYPAEGGMTVVYTPKSNGMKEDIVLEKSTTDKMNFSYEMKLPSDLQAKILDNGGLGIYSADPSLYGNDAFGDGQDIEKIKSARETADKDHLLFAIPAPVIKQTGGSKPTADARFVLDGTTLRVETSGMSALHYPVTVDPSVTVTSSSDFGGGTPDSNIDFPSNQVNRGSLTGGSISAYTSTGSGSYASRTQGSGIAYNGYMYYVGGAVTGGGTDIAYAPMNSSTGALGTWASGTSLPIGYRYPGVAVYNGYLYVYGGHFSSTTPSADVLSAPISPTDGSLGSWTSVSTMATAACRFGYTAYNGYIYAVAGNIGTVAASCGNSSPTPTNTTQFAKLGANGTVGSWTTSASTLTNAVMSPSTVAYNGYLYTVGGTTDGTTAFNTTQYARINPATGDIGAWATSSFTISANNYRMGITAYNGYIYVLGGISNSTQTQYTQVRENGDIGKWYQTSTMSPGRFSLGVGAYNGYLYFMAGSDAVGGTGAQNDAWYAKIDPAGTPSAFTSTTNFTTNRRGLKMVAYNGYVYVLGGDAGGTPVSSAYYATANSDGATGSYTITTAMPANLTFFGAVAYNGYMYVLGGCTSAFASCTTTGNNVATVYKSAINASTGALGAWSTETSFTTARYGTQAVAYNGYLYVIGGLNGSTFKNDIQYHAIGASGAISGAWSTSAQTIATAARAYFGAAVNGGKLYIAGGCSAGALTCTTTRNDVQYATFGGSGDLSGAFTTNATSFTTPRGGHELLIAYGNMYIVGGWNGTTYYNTTQMAPLASDGSVGTWSSGAAFTNNRFGLGAVAYRGYLIIGGGYNGTTYYNTTQYTYLNNGGGFKTGSYATTGNTSSTTKNYGVAQYNGVMYEAGGSVSSTPSTITNYAAVNSGGTMANWTSGGSLNTARESPGVYATNGYLYAVGGRSGASTYSAGTEYAQINSDGTLGSWTAATAALPSGRSGGAYANYNGYLYYLGGNDGSSDLTTVAMASVGSGGNFSSWSTTTALPTATYGASAVAYNGYMYLIGGGTKAGSYYATTYYAAINSSDGTLGSWTATTSLPTAMYASAVGYNGIMYVVGGYDGSYETNVYQASINSSGALSLWEGGVAISSSSSVAQKAIAYKGYMYSFQASTQPYYAAVDTTPRSGNYSKIIGLGAGYALAGISYNGTLPGGIYNINYRTADTDGAFGSLSNASGLTGSIANCAGNNVAYVLTLVTLDDSGSAVFPDSSSAEANITDLTVSYSGTRASPSQRLAHGKYFQDASLQPLDTCGA